MNYQKRIVVDPKIMVGKPVIKGTRITVELILKLLAQGVTVDELISQKYYPHLQKFDVYAAIEYATELIREERVYPLTWGRNLYSTPFSKGGESLYGSKQQTAQETGR